MFGLRSLAISSTATILLALGVPASQAGALTFAPDGSTTDTATSNTVASSTDWSGWDVTGDTYTSVSASWTVPTVTCAATETSYSADWVGLDGDGSDSVEQTGTSSDCDSGTAVYSAWYEFYPSVSVTLPGTLDEVKAGDRISASVVSVKGSDQFKLALTDHTQKWTKTQTGDSPSGTGASAEIIAEAPSGSERSDSVLPLADFKTTTFSDIKVNGTGLTEVGGAQKIAMVDDSGNPMATVSALTGAGTADKFTVTWVSSGVDTSGEQTGSGFAGGSGDSGGYEYGSGGDGSGGFGYGFGYGYGSGGTGNDGQDGYGLGGWGDSTGSWGYSTGNGYGAWAYTSGGGTDSFWLS